MDPRHRTYIVLASCAFLFLVGFRNVSFDPSPTAVALSNAFVVLLAIPSFIGAVRWLGRKKGIVLLLVMGTVPVVVEGISIVTGLPYGDFSYSPNLGPRILGLVPPVVAFAYLPLLLGSVTLTWRRAGEGLRERVFASTLFLLFVDLVIDPAAVHTGIWAYSGPAVYYGVPLSNFIGWLVTGAIYTAMVHGISTLGGEPPSHPPVLMAAGLLLTLSLWSGFLFREMLLVPAALGLGLALGTGYLILSGEGVPEGASPGT